MRSIRSWYRDASIVGKLTIFSVSMIILGAIILTFLVKALFETTVLDNMRQNYIDKFDVISSNCMNLFDDAQQLSTVMLTDERIQDWFRLNENSTFAERVQHTLNVERQLDYVDAIRRTNQFSSITIYSLNGGMVNTNRARISSKFYQSLYQEEPHKFNRAEWVDLYRLSDLSGHESGIAYFHPYRDPMSGALLGHVMVEYSDTILREHFAQLGYSDLGEYIVADSDGNIKISSAAERPVAEGLEQMLELAGGEDGEDKILTLDGERYLVAGARIQTLDWVMIVYVPVRWLTRSGDSIVSAIYIVALMGILVAVFANQWILRAVMRPLTHLADAMQRFGEGQLSVSVAVSSGDEVGRLSQGFNDMALHVRELVEQVRREQRDKRHFEFSALQAQINPHFLYNTLNSVCSLIMTKRLDDAYAMVRSLGTFYRTALSNGQVIISIEEEIENIKSYIHIQTMRYGDKIHYDLAFDRGILRERIVKFTLQPLIENAIYHGVKQTENPGMIRVTGAREGALVVIRVIDNGTGMDDQKRVALLNPDADTQSKAFGLTNIDRRLKLYFGQEYGLYIESTPGEGTTVVVNVPCAFEEGID